MADDEKSGTSSLASKATQVVVLRNAMDMIAAEAAADAAQLGQTDEHPREGPSGRLDVVLMRLYETREDRRGKAYRAFDEIESDHDKSFIAALVQRRWKDKDRRVSTREVQKVVDIAATVGVKWANAHRGEGNSRVRIVLPNGETPHA